MVRLHARDYALPLRNCVAVLLIGLLAGERATVRGLAETLHALVIIPAKEESLARHRARPQQLPSP